MTIYPKVFLCALIAGLAGCTQPRVTPSSVYLKMPAALPAGSPRLLSQGKLRWPAFALRNEIEGAIVVDVFTDERGNVTDARIASRKMARELVMDPASGQYVDVRTIFDEPSLSSVRASKFSPAIKDGAPVAAWSKIRLVWLLDDSLRRKVAAPVARESSAARLEELNRLLEQRLISESEFNAKKAEILKEL